MSLNFIHFKINQIKDNIKLNILFDGKKLMFHKPRYQWSLLDSIEKFLLLQHIISLRRKKSYIFPPVYFPGTSKQQFFRTRSIGMTQAFRTVYYVYQRFFFATLAHMYSLSLSVTPWKNERARRRKRKKRMILALMLWTEFPGTSRCRNCAYEVFLVARAQAFTYIGSLFSSCSDRDKNASNNHISHY